MQVRQAKIQDRDEFVRLANLFLTESSYPIKMNLMKLMTSFLRAIELDEIVLFVAEDNNKLVGMLVGVVNESLFSNDKIASELAWFVEKEYRGTSMALRLLAEFEKWAKLQDCSFIAMIDLHRVNDLENMYNKLGYELAEKTYMKKV